MTQELLLKGNDFDYLKTTMFKRLFIAFYNNVE